MVIIVHSEKQDDTIATALGEPEYSYYFVLQAFLPVLERLGVVVRVRRPEQEVDALHVICRELEQDCVFLSFSPPHRTPVGLTCPTICVFAWEFEHVPTESWDDNPRHDWRYVLERMAGSITHSSHAARTVRATMGDTHPVLAVPAPLWDRYATAPDPRSPRELSALTLRFRGHLIDSREEHRADSDEPPAAQAVTARVAVDIGAQPKASPVRRNAPLPEHELVLDGVIYTTVFNPDDGRKNWQDMVRCFCVALGRQPDATLVLKAISADAKSLRRKLRAELGRLRPFQCRVVLVDAFLDDEDYQALATRSSYAVNASLGEGQCLPLMEYLSRGKPAVSPRHTGMEDYIDADVAFIVKSSLEPASWPHDPRAAVRTLRHRIDAESLMAAYEESYRVATEQPERYREMCENATRRLQGHASGDVVAEKLRGFLTERLASRSEESSAGGSG